MTAGMYRPRTTLPAVARPAMPSGRRRVVAAAVAVSVLAGGVVAVATVTAGSGPSMTWVSEPSDAPVITPGEQAAVAVAATFVSDTAVADGAARQRATASWASPERMSELLATVPVVDGRPAGSPVVDVRPLAFKITFAQQDVFLVAVWAQGRSLRTGAPAWSVETIGVHRTGAGMRVYAYAGSTPDVEPDDPRLEGFVQLAELAELGAPSASPAGQAGGG